MGFPSSMHQDIQIFCASIMKTRSGRFDSSQIDQRIVVRAGRSLSAVHFRDIETFPAPRRGCARFLARPANESAKRFAGYVEAGVGEPLRSEERRVGKEWRARCRAWDGKERVRMRHERT